MAESMSVCASQLMQGASGLSSLRATRLARAAAPSGSRMLTVRAAGTQKGGSQKGGVNPVKSDTSQPGTLQGGGTRYVGGKKVTFLTNMHAFHQNSTTPPGYIVLNTNLQNYLN